MLGPVLLVVGLALCLLYYLLLGKALMSHYTLVVQAKRHHRGILVNTCRHLVPIIEVVTNCKLIKILRAGHYF
jgi:hypothetical protein